MSERKLPQNLQTAIDDVAAQRPYKIVGQPETYSDYNQGWTDACDIAEQAIETEWVSIQTEIERLRAGQWVENDLTVFQALLQPTYTAEAKLAAIERLAKDEAHLARLVNHHYPLIAATYENVLEGLRSTALSYSPKPTGPDGQ